MERNASGLSGFIAATSRGMKLGDAPDRLSGTNPFKSLSSHMGCLSDYCMVASKDGSAV